jgi:hypothetical protein
MSNDAPAVPVDDAAWPVKARAARISLRPLTALLSVLLIATVAVYAGARLEKREHGSASSATGASAFSAFSAAGFGRNRAGAAGGTGAAATGSAVTTGTVTEVTKKLLYLTSSTGALIKVGLTAKTTFTRTAASPTGGLSLGDTAIVRGAKNASGVLVATTVIATAKGVTSTFGGGAGGFGGFRGNAQAGG